MKRLVALIALIMGMTLLIASCSSSSGSSSPSSGSSANGKTPVIIDTDVDSDDAMAILYLMSNPNVEVIGLSISGDGFMLQNEATPTALQIAALGGKPNVPVSYGAYVPITPLEGFPDAWRKGALEFYKNAGMPPITTPPDYRSADQLIVDLVKASPEKVTILGLAPNTNIANALSNDPSIASNIQQIVLSAGAFGIPGNMTAEKQTPELLLETSASYRSLAAAVDKNNAAEYNVALDAAATSAIIQSGVPVLFSPLNASQQAPVDAAFVNQLKAGPQNGITKFVIGDVGPMVAQGVPTFMWDPVAAAMIVDPSICTDLQNSGAAVDVSNTANYGATVTSQYGKKVNICMSMNPQAFFTDFNNTVANPK